ncbi:hypothetical protein IV38_GL000471 [Lactobacillus selangorensis]|uniref:Uncharacterized protein n=1 Tax=Lactobacillus selangorensis TaxID=81857 RepID=A0A0R2GAW0_9LACO|nr:alpha/beta hydrolase [Lactobacillus selangorensis]KRN29585.1 hypothetical protein IV38_GL000471 [Lactobacillus selangorensis]KRN33885.1 hypothetical protein IV40_GL000197 [Lactobacillus selangorensis]
MITEQSFLSQDFLMSYLAKDNESTQNILFLHDLAINKTVYAQVMRNCTTANCFAMDFRYHGHSAARGPQTVASFGKDIINWIKALQVKQYTIVASGIAAWIVESIQKQITPDHYLFLDGGYHDPRLLPDPLTEIPLPQFDTVNLLSAAILTQISGMRASGVTFDEVSQQALYIAMYHDYRRQDEQYSNHVLDAVYLHVYNDLQRHHYALPEHTTLIRSEFEQTIDNAAVQSAWHLAGEGAQLITVPKTNHYLMVTQPQAILKAL